MWSPRCELPLTHFLEEEAEACDEFTSGDLGNEDVKHATKVAVDRASSSF